MTTNSNDVGASQVFVLGRGVKQIERGHWVLVGTDGGLRLFAELTADLDRSNISIGDAYQAVLSSMQPGWTMRMLQIFWPDPLPRDRFTQYVSQWAAASEEDPNSKIAVLHQSLNLYLQEAPLPFVRRTILEFALAGNLSEAVEWWEGILAMLKNYGIQATPLTGEDIVALARWIFNPSLDF
ncbi:hypothetical protein D6833_13060 [Candidatus Parcubacteria bacterium]|nr:MAG: hypothetical protein D6833_13060 [Candidatus Parcubacteria bacterium]